MIDAKDALMEKIRNLDEKIAKKLLDERDDILLQIELESDESFLEDVERARNGEKAMDHDELKNSSSIAELKRWCDNILSKL